MMLSAIVEDGRVVWRKHLVEDFGGDTKGAGEIRESANHRASIIVY